MQLQRMLTCAQQSRLFPIQPSPLVAEILLPFVSYSRRRVFRLSVFAPGLPWPCG